MKDRPSSSSSGDMASFNDSRASRCRGAPTVASVGRTGLTPVKRGHIRGRHEPVSQSRPSVVNRDGRKASSSVSIKMGSLFMLGTAALLVARLPSSAEAMPLAASTSSSSPALSMRSSISPELVSSSSLSRRESASDAIQEYLSEFVEKFAAAAQSSTSDSASEQETSQQNLARSRYVSNVHPLGRRSALQEQPYIAAAALSRRGPLYSGDEAVPLGKDDETVSFNVEDRDVADDVDSLAARAPAPPQVIPVTSAATSDDDDSKASDSKSTSSSQPPSSSSSSPSSSSSSSSTSSASPSSTSDSKDKDSKDPNAPITSPHSKLFPLFVGGVVAAGLLCFMFFIAVAKQAAHACMRRDQKRGLIRNNTIPKAAAAGGGGGAGARRTGTLRRAVTRTLGSFARRNRNGSVLIDVGDEVLAVPPEVAEEYERERKSVLSGGSSGGSSGGGLTWDGRSSRSSSPLRIALRNAELAAAARSQRTTIKEEDEDEKMGARSGGAEEAETRRKPDVLDINQWRSTLDSQPQGQPRPLLLGQRQQQQQQQQQQQATGGLSRTLSQRLVDSLKALRATGSQESLSSMYKSDGSKQSSKDDSYNSDPEKQAADARNYLPVITRGGGGGWDVQPSRQQQHAESQQQQQQQARKPAQAPRRRDTTRVPGGFPTNSSGEEASDGTFGPRRDPVAVGAYKHRQQPDNANGPRTGERNATRTPRGGADKIQSVARGADVTSARRNAKPSSTAMASPKMLNKRSSQDDLHAQPRQYNRAFVGPAFPEKAQSKGPSTAMRPAQGPARKKTAPRFRVEEESSSDYHRRQAQSGQTNRELFRPLPLPPSFSPLGAP